MFFSLSILLLVCLVSPQCYIPNCNLCGGNVCLECQPPYILQNGLCVGESCMANSCLTCDYNKFWCVQCTPMYQVKAGACAVATYIIVAPIIIFFIALVLCVFYCIFRAHHRKMRRRALEQLYNQQRSASPIPVSTSDHLLDNPDFVFNYQHEKEFCSICLQGNSNLITQCGHYFHADCFSSWIRRHKICPICNNKDLQFVIVMLCMKCKKKYYHYQTYLNFLLQVKVDMQRACNYCAITRLEGEKQKQKQSQKQRDKQKEKEKDKIRIQEGLQSQHVIIAAEASQANL